MSNSVTQFKSLLFVLIRNTFSIDKMNKASISKKKQIAGKAVIGFFIVAMMLYVGFMASAMASALLVNGLLEELLYAAFFTSQFVVLFFGGFAVMNYLYFSKDNALLSTLPISSRITFLAKFIMAYLAELFFAVITAVPMLLGIGITALTMGAQLSISFFPIALLSVLLVPVIPLLLVTIISLPIMYLITFLKKRAVGTGLLSALVYILILGLYFAFIGFMSGLGDNVDETTGAVILPNGALKFLIAIKSATVFNRHIIKALLGVNPALNLLFYLLFLAALGVATIGLASLFYKKAVNMTAESEGGAFGKKSKKVTSDDYLQSASVGRTFLLKEIRTLIKTPTLFVSTVISALMTPMMSLFFMLVFNDTDAEGISSSAFLVSFLTYIGIIAVSMNQIALIGFSREGKHLLTLKTLPVSAKTILKAKLIFSTLLTVIIVLISTVVFPFATKIYNPIAIIGFFLVLITQGIGMNCFGLYNDLKNPTIRWMNINELTKNNKRVMKPVLISIVIGLFALIFGIVLSMQNKINGSLLYLLYYGVSFVPSLCLAVIGYLRLFKNPEAMFDKIEG